MRTKKAKFVSCVLLVALLASAPAFSQGLFSLGVGANISYPADAIAADPSGSSSLDKKSKFRFEDIAVGLETRVRIDHLQFAAVGELSTVDSSTILASGILSAGLSFDLLSLFRIGVSAGPKVSYAYSEAGSKDPSSGSDPSVDLGNTSNGKNLWSAIKDGNFNIRLTFDIMAGPVMTIGVAYVVPTEFSIDNGNYKDLIPKTDAWGEGKVSICVQMSLI